MEKKLYKVTMLQNFIKTYLVSTPLMKVENTRHFPSVDVVARRICSQYLRNKHLDTRNGCFHPDNDIVIVQLVTKEYTI